mgnify:CR=1 FL=1
MWKIRRVILKYSKPVTRWRLHTPCTEANEIMKKYQLWIFCVAIVCMCVPAKVFAYPQFRMAIIAGTDFAERPSYLDIGAGFNNPANVFEGVLMEVITEPIVGFGFKGLVRFTDTTEVAEMVGTEDWRFDWNGEVFISAHLLGGGAFVDPFLEVGYGCVGRVNLSNSRSGEWSESEEGLWSYRFYGDSDEGVSNLSLFPVVSAGVAFDLVGFLIGARISYRPVVHAVPAATFSNYPLTQFHFGVFGGLALGGHR